MAITGYKYDSALKSYQLFIIFAYNQFMQTDLPQCDVLKKPADQKKKAHAYSLPPELAKEIERVADNYGMSKSKFMERAAKWYLHDLSKSADRVKEPTPEP